jgi:AhpD family alkylhydroperoxidase
MPDTLALQPRMPHAVQLVPDALKALHALHKAAEHPDVPATTRYLVELRASQINGCSVCAEMHSRELKEAGESDERIWTVAAWREAPFFTEPERAALALTEALTRIADRPDAVSDEIWEEAARHYDEAQLAALVLSIASINTWNRVNGATRQITGDWVEQVIHAAA